MVGAWLRRTAFWTIDALKGGSIRAHYQDIARQMTQTDRSQTVERILTHASQTTEYYRGMSAASLYGFPVVNKQIIKENPEAFRSDAYPDEHALHATYTGGSSGVPFRSFQNGNKRNRTVADLLYCHNSIGWRLGERYIFIRG